MIKLNHGVLIVHVLLLIKHASVLFLLVCSYHTQMVILRANYLLLQDRCVLGSQPVNVRILLLHLSLMKLVLKHALVAQHDFILRQTLLVDHLLRYVLATLISNPFLLKVLLASLLHRCREIIHMLIVNLLLSLLSLSLSLHVTLLVGEKWIVFLRCD
jgi:hypothetical protein